MESLEVELYNFTGVENVPLKYWIEVKSSFDKRSVIPFERLLKISNQKRIGNCRAQFCLSHTQIDSLRCIFLKKRRWTSHYHSIIKLFVLQSL